VYFLRHGVVSVTMAVVIILLLMSCMAAYMNVCKRRQSEHEIKDSFTMLEEKHLKKRQRLSIP